MHQPFLRTAEARQARRRLEEDPQIAEARLQLLARLRLGAQRAPASSTHLRLLPEVGARSTIREIEQLRPLS